MHLALKNVCWLIGGVIYSAPTEEQLRSLAQGDYALLTPPPSKADQFSLHWGASTIYLAYYPSEAAHPTCAAREELRRQIPAAKRADVPLFVREGDAPWRHGQLSDTFSEMMGVVCGSAEAAKPYSIHSFRVYLACALLSAGASSGTIQTMLRWRSDDALRIYARINDYKYSEWLDRTAVATVSSVRTTTQAMVQRMWSWPRRGRRHARRRASRLTGRRRPLRQTATSRASRPRCTRQMLRWQDSAPTRPCSWRTPRRPTWRTPPSSAALPMASQ